MEADLMWNEQFRVDVEYGFLGSQDAGSGHYNPRLVLNANGSTVEHSLVEELGRAESFTFSVAFVSASAIAQLKQHLLDFKGAGRIINSNYLGFNDPTAFSELLKLNELLGIDVRIHESDAFHPKGYVFTRDRSITAIVGSSNLTGQALSRNHEWNLRVSAVDGSDLANQFGALVEAQVQASAPITQEWIDNYAATYIAPARPAPRQAPIPGTLTVDSTIQPNSMQQDALLALDFVRAEGNRRAIIISATGTGKTMLSALDVRAVDPQRLLFIAHREQILGRTVQEYQRVLTGSTDDYGKLTGSHKQQDRRYVFATIQTLAQEAILASLAQKSFDYIIVDEAHRAGADTYRRVIDHFTPDFLLGMTATPERTDGFNVFELFDYNVPYEIRLNRALEAEMLAPFHYYGIADIEFEDGTTTTDATPLTTLASPERVKHVARALDVYGQAGVEPQGLIFCSRTEEARALAKELNKVEFRGRRLRTVALTGSDSIEAREQAVSDLESGQLDYILTVDIFNEGVDIPTVNQVIMLRQTQSAIVFVQQLGRGLRPAKDKNYLVVIDFIGNYANNFLIPIALFGDESLNRESLRERLNETVEGGTLPGLSSVSFDEISRARVLKAITDTSLDSLTNLRNALVAMQNRVGGVPTLWDFYRFESVDPVLLATKKEHYPALVASLLRVGTELSPAASRSLCLLSHEMFAAKRLHEFVLLELLLSQQQVSDAEIAAAFDTAGLASDRVHVESAIGTFTLEGYSQTDRNRYQSTLAERLPDAVALTHAFASELDSCPALVIAVRDLIKTGSALTQRKYQSELVFTPGMQYSRRDAARLVGWSRATASTIYGYKTDENLGVATIFVTLHKADDVVASTAYQDELLDQTTMRWYSKNNRNLESRDVRGIVSGAVDVHVFVKKDDAEGSDHYYLGQATAEQATETTMPDGKGGALPVVTMLLKFGSPVRQGLYDYFHPRRIE